MSEADETPFRFKAETAWRDLDALPIILVNQAVGQVLQGDIVVTFGRVMPPPLIGSDEQKQRQVEALGVLPIIPVVRLTMTINRLREFKKTLEEPSSSMSASRSFLRSSESRQPRKMRRHERDG